MRTYNNNIKYIILFLYCSLSPITWFSSFSIGIVKRLVLFLIVILFYNCLLKWNKATIIFIICIALVSANILNHGGSILESNIILGIIENYIFFQIGRSQLMLSDFKKYHKVIIFLPAITCALTITNFLIGIPDWHTLTDEVKEAIYAEQNISYEYRKLWQTGFSWGRNGWGCTLAVLFPMCFLNRSRKSYLFIPQYLILLSVFITGCRNGLLSICLSSFLFIMYFVRKTNKHNNLLIFAFFVLFFIILFNWDYFSHALRLDSSDITSSRYDQYLLIPDMLSKTSFWGNGNLWTQEYLSNFGLPFLLHNTHFRMLIEFGYIPGAIIFGITIKAFSIAKRSLHSRNRECVAISTIIFGGLLLTLFEPQIIFAVFGFPLWWLVFGFLSNNNIKMLSKC